MKMGVHEHKSHSYSLKIGVITVSSTRNKENDESGKIIMEEIEKNGHKVCEYAVVKDSKMDILTGIFNFLPHCDVIILNGGTGISQRDVTVESIEPILDKKLVGFGEIFRMLSYEEIGTAAMMSRALAGICCGKLIFSIPGSKGAAKTACKLIFSELNHMWYEINKEKGWEKL
jgi:molybdenum cofactor biosynthesis protein B